jgi:threonine/homoserine/homoserine lactone efflux protein
VIYIVTRSVVQGKRSGLASVAGVALGNLANAITASIGLAAVFAASSTAFLIVKYAGAGYLIYLGLQMALRRTDAATVKLEMAPPGRVLRDGFIVALFNPKTTVFFAAFLPQFLTAGSPPMLQSLVLGAAFVAVAALTDGLYAFAASAVAPYLARSTGLGRLRRWLGGGAYIGMGLVAALTGGHGGR